MPSRPLVHIALPAAVLVALTIDAGRAHAQNAAGVAQSQLCNRADDAAEGRARAQAASRQGGAAGAFAQGCLALAERRYEPAAAAFEQAVRAEEGNAVYHFFLGQAYGIQAQRASVFAKAGLARKVKAAFERAVALDPDYLDAREGLMQYYIQAPGFMGGSEQKGREQAFEIRKRSPYRGAFLYAQLAARSKDGAGVVRELEGLTRQFPDSVAPYLQLAATQLQQRNTAGAWATAERLLRARPDARAAQYAVGRVAAESGEQLDRGAAALGRYLQARPGPGDPPLANAHWRLGAIYERQGKKAEARAEYETALRLNPGLGEVKTAVARVR